MSARVYSAWCLMLVSTACLADADSRGLELTQLAESFRPVSTMLGARCASLDCHGQTSRRLRLYSSRGLRLNAEDSSGHGGTRAAEHEANLTSSIALEPELFERVIAEQGRDPYRLTLLRKAAGKEAHIGGTVLDTGDPGRACLTSWLAQTVDETACAEATQASEREP